VEPLSELNTSIITPALRRTRGQHPVANALKNIITAAEDLAGQLRTNRGHELYEGSALTKLREHYSNLSGDSELERGPFRLVIDEIAKRGQRIKPQGQLNWLYAARLAYEDGLIQQTCSLLREGAVSYVCRLNELNPGKAHDRELIEKSLNALGNKVPEENYDFTEANLSKGLAVMESEPAKKIASVFTALTPIRNDLMHAGYYTEEGRDNARSSKRVFSKIKTALESFEGLLLS
jgi:hypothetical protein